MILRIQPLGQEVASVEKLFRWDDALTNRSNTAYDSACPRSGEISERAKWEKSKR
jgi:hypothetical protein